MNGADKARAQYFSDRRNGATTLAKPLIPHLSRLPHVIELPTELWLRIAQYIPDTDLFRLESVNRLFLDLVTDRRYRQLTIDDDHPGPLIRKLSRIERDPSVAARVRSLTVHPKAVRSACLRAGKTNRRQRSVKNRYWPDSFRTERTLLEEDTELADRFLDALAHLSAIEEYAIEWDHGVESERSFCLPLLSAIWPLYGHNLRSIKLNMTLGHLAYLHLSCSDARYGTWGGPGHETQQALERLAAFVNRLALSLRSLSISSIAHLDFSWLYANLTYFPLLARLALLVPCDPRHVVDPTGLHHFLHLHKDTLANLAFSPQYCCYQSALGPSRPAPAQPSAACATTEDWLGRAFGGVAFQHLHSLELGLNIVGSGGKRVMPAVPRIGAAAKDVESLGILGCIIALEDLRVLLHPFSQGTHILAASLPGLHTLDLTYRWVGSSGATNVVCSADLLSVYIGCVTEARHADWIHGGIGRQDLFVLVISMASHPALLASG
ncbi:hypothetical protein BJ912DRAFT_1056048 [Pholiota molesta]|nr:hypothetical protein BJ912DRAFT_1056048 [Pholiota molesta]